MLSFPDKYKKDNRIPLTPFLKSSITAAEKKKFKEVVEEIKITYQIEGFDIPNLVNDDYNCQAIAFLVVKLKDLKSAAFVGKIIQKEVKILCVIELTDGTDECFCFADKRLNKQDKNEIILEDVFITDTLPLNFENDTKTLFNLYVDYDSILNHSNKRNYYMEMMTKSFIVFNTALFSGTEKLLESKLWYNDEKIIECYSNITELKKLKLAALKANSVADKGKINKNIKGIIGVLKLMI